MLISLTFEIAPSSIQGGPQWIYTDIYQMTLVASVPAAHADLMRLSQQAIIKAFQLQYHIEAKPSPVYRLEASRSTIPSGGGPEPATKAELMGGTREFSSVAQLVSFLNGLYYSCPKCGNPRYPVEDGTGPQAVTRSCLISVLRQI
ncbi:MAG TPA: DUF3738 domain-containing protein [Terriglobales bacterium]|nr:DUF3738 domain-containing protein [Terriglobales bacterium]